MFLLFHLITQDQVQSLQEEVATLTEFGVLQSGQLHQQQEDAQFHNKLWAVAQEECWNAQKKVIQQNEEIVELKKEIVIKE